MSELLANIGVALQMTVWLASVAFRLAVVLGVLFLALWGFVRLVVWMAA